MKTEITHSANTTQQQPTKKKKFHNQGELQRNTELKLGD